MPPPIMTFVSDVHVMVLCSITGDHWKHERVSRGDTCPAAVRSTTRIRMDPIPNKYSSGLGNTDVIPRVFN